MSKRGRIILSLSILIFVFVVHILPVNSVLLRNTILIYATSKLLYIQTRVNLSGIDAYTSKRMDRLLTGSVIFVGVVSITVPELTQILSYLMLGILLSAETIGPGGLSELCCQLINQFGPISRSTRLNRLLTDVTSSVLSSGYSKPESHSTEDVFTTSEELLLVVEYSQIHSHPIESGICQRCETSSDLHETRIFHRRTGRMVRMPAICESCLVNILGETELVTDEEIVSAKI